MNRVLFLIPVIVFAGLAALFAIGLMRDNPEQLPAARVGQVALLQALIPLGTASRSPMSCCNQVA